MSCPRCGATDELLDAEARLFGGHVCERVSMRAWHDAGCARRLEDPGEVCTCRPPRGEDISIAFGRGKVRAP